MAHKEEEFNERWEAMQIRYTDFYGGHMDYLEFDITNLQCQKVVNALPARFNILETLLLLEWRINMLS